MPSRVAGCMVITVAFVCTSAVRGNPTNLQSGICSLVPQKLRTGKVGELHATYCTAPTMTATAAPYEKLVEMCREISSLEAVGGILGWDEQVMMPDGGANSRGKQKSALAAVLHEKQTSKELKDLISSVKSDMSSLGPYELAVVRDADRSYRHMVGVPKELEKEMAEHEVASVQAWVKARKENDFKSFVPYLLKSVDLVKKYAKATRPDSKPYDGAIDMFERGMSADRLAEIFSEIAGPLKDLTSRIIAAKGNLPEIHPALKGGDEWTIEKQSEFSKEVSKVLCFDYTRGRIDVSVHPFTGGAGPSDTRITTRYSTSDPFQGIMGTIHETGHALYEQGRNPDFVGLPVSEALSMGVHESQSLFWEKMIGQSEEFWQSVLPILHQKLPHTKSVTARDVYVAVNQVSRSLIRVDADECFYPFHIMLRFEIEKGLMNGTINANDLPAVWQEKFKEYIGIDVPNDSDGCLQDIHWPSGAIGYFPSYSLGMMMAAQLYSFLKTNAMPDIKEKVAKGEFKDIKDWLNKNIHEKGSLYTSLDDLLFNVTGEPLKPSYFVDYLNSKYSEIYKL